INYNTVSDYHWDESDEPNSLCCLVTLGDFDGGELCFLKLKIIVPLHPRQVIVFSSRLLLHGNFPVMKGIRHSVMYFVHSSFFYHLRDFSSVYDNLKTSVERDAKGNVVSGPMWHQNLEDACKLNRQIHLFKPKAEQIQISPQPSDRRRGCIDLSHAKHGLRAEDPLPNS
ncbi:13698_t:CDS:2, partial [Racocetra persica]